MNWRYCVSVLYCWNVKSPTLPNARNRSPMPAHCWPLKLNAFVISVCHAHLRLRLSQLNHAKVLCQRTSRLRLILRMPVKAPAVVAWVKEHSRNGCLFTFQPAQVSNVLLYWPLAILKRVSLNRLSGSLIFSRTGGIYQALPWWMRGVHSRLNGRLFMRDSQRCSPSVRLMMPFAGRWKSYPNVNALAVVSAVQRLWPLRFTRNVTGHRCL